MKVGVQHDDAEGQNVARVHCPKRKRILAMVFSGELFNHSIDLLRFAGKPNLTILGRTRANQEPHEGTRISKENSMPRAEHDGNPTSR